MDLVDARDAEFCEAIQPILLRKLAEGLEKNQLVNVSGLRNIGKSVALVEFAKKENLPIVASCPSYFINELNYDFVYSKLEFGNMLKRGYSLDTVLFDETVDTTDLDLRNLKVTGFYSKF